MSWWILARSGLETARQNQSAIYVCNRLAELYDHLWLLLADGLRDHITERLQIKQIVAAEVATELLKVKLA